VGAETRRSPCLCECAFSCQGTAHNRPTTGYFFLPSPQQATFSYRAHNPDEKKRAPPAAPAASFRPPTARVRAPAPPRARDPPGISTPMTRDSIPLPRYHELPRRPFPKSILDQNPHQKKSISGGLVKRRNQPPWGSRSRAWVGGARGIVVVVSVSSPPNRPTNARAADTATRNTVATRVVRWCEQTAASDDVARLHISPPASHTSTLAVRHHSIPVR
jgi:hypothetical protein